MGLKHTRFRGKIKLHGRPKEQAKAEIMLMNAESKQIDRQRRRRLFTLLDFIIIISFALALYSIYAKQYLNMFLFIIVGLVPLAYFIIRRILKNKNPSHSKLWGIFKVPIGTKEKNIVASYGVLNPIETNKKNSSKK